MEPLDFGQSDNVSMFDTEKLLRELESEIHGFPGALQEASDTYYAELQKIRDKWESRKTKLRDKHEENLKKLAALKEQAEREAESKIMGETARIVTEICKDFDAWGKAHPYQLEDVISIVHAYLTGQGGILNANEMGLGKTYEAIIALYICIELFQREHNRKPSVLWLTKSSILETDSTKKEIALWWPDFKCVSISGSESKDSREFKLQIAHGGGYAVLSNYEIVRTTEFAKEATWDFVVLDEVHKLKGGANPNGPTQIWKAVKDVCLQAKFVQMLSGTPLVNKPEEMWSYLHIFDPVLFPSAREFARRFGDVRQLGAQTELVLNVNRLLKQALKGRMIRRTAVEVGQELPELIEQRRELPWNQEQADLYRQMRDKFFIWIEEEEGKGTLLSASAIIAQLTRLRQINVLPKFIWRQKDEDGNIISEVEFDVNDSSKIDEVEDIVLAAQDQVVIFSNFNEPMFEIKRRLNGIGISCEIICGATKKDMKNYEEKFQQGEITVLCLNSSMGEGLNLQKFPSRWPGGAAVGIFLDRWWNKARDDQCYKRIYRQGADRPVFIYHLFCQNSVDYFVEELSDRKKRAFDQVTEADDIRPAGEWKKFLKGLI